MLNELMALRVQLILIDAGETYAKLVHRFVFFPINDVCVGQIGFESYN